MFRKIDEFFDPYHVETHELHRDFDKFKWLVWEEMSDEARIKTGGDEIRSAYEQAKQSSKERERDRFA